jgi:hypothetical protein
MPKDSPIQNPRGIPPIQICRNRFSAVNSAFPIISRRVP